MVKILRKHWPAILIAILISLYTIFFSYFTILRHHNYYSYRYDLGNMEQTIWNTIKGNVFIMTDPEGFGNISRLKYHADFFLILLSPIYALFPKTETLLVLQSLALAFGAVPIYWLAKEVLKKKELAVIPVIFYLLYPALQRSNYFDFHAVKFATTFLLFAFYFLYKKKYLLFILFSALSITCKEQIPLIVALMNFYGAAKDEKFRRGGIIFGIITLVYFFYIFFKVIPGFRETNIHFVFKHFFISGSQEEKSKLLLNINFLKEKRLWLMLLQLFLPLFFIPILKPLYLVFGFPDLIPRILSNNIYYRSIDFQYNNPVIPFIFIAFIFGFEKYLRLIERLKINLVIGLIIPISVCFVCLYFWSPFSASFTGVKAKKILIGREEKSFIDQFKKRVPEETSVCATNNLGSHFSKRWLLYSFPNNVLEADYTLILKGDGNMMSAKTTEEKVKQLEQSSRYEKMVEYKDFIAFKKIIK